MLKRKRENDEEGPITQVHKVDAEELKECQQCLFVVHPNQEVDTITANATQMSAILRDEDQEFWAIPGESPIQMWLGARAQAKCEYAQQNLLAHTVILKLGGSTANARGKTVFGPVVFCLNADAAPLSVEASRRVRKIIHETKEHKTRDDSPTLGPVAKWIRKFYNKGTCRVWTSNRVLYSITRAAGTSRVGPACEPDEIAPQMFRMYYHTFHTIIAACYRSSLVVDKRTLLSTKAIQWSSSGVSPRSGTASMLIQGADLFFY